MRRLTKQLTRLTLLVIATMLPQLASAHDFEVGGIYYNINGNNATVTYRGSSYDAYSNEYTGAVNIPSTVTYNGTTYSVTSIGWCAFYGCGRLTSVTIPNSVTYIGDEAFRGCSGLNTVTWNPKNCSDFSRSSYTPFNGLTGITSFVFGNEVEHIPAYLCYGLTGLTSVTIPNSVKSIGWGAFEGCSGLTSVNITDLAAWCNIVFVGYDFNEGSNPLNYAHNLYLNGSKVTNLVIPSSVTSIGEGAFSGCSGLTSVTIPNSVTSIGESAFAGCSGLTSVTIGNSVKTIGYYAFSGCTGLNRVNINNLESWCKINFGFENCSPDFVIIHSNPLIYAHNLYLNGNMITDLVIPNSIIDIGNFTFAGCSGLTSVTIPNSVKSIGHYAFDGCTGLSKVHISDIAAWCNIDFANNFFIYYGSDYNYKDCSSNPLMYAHNLFLNGSELTDLVIPDTISTIKKNTFFNCHSLTSVTIPNSVKTIGEKAFYNCSSLTSVTLPYYLSSVGGGAFLNCPSSVIWNAKDCKVSTIQDCYNDECGFCYDSPFGGYEWNPGGIITNYNNSINSFSFGRDVERIPSFLCRGLRGLTTLTIPNSVKSIGWGAFADCSGLESVYSRIRDPQNVNCGISIFCNLNYVFADDGFEIEIHEGELLDFDLYVPHGKREVYEQTSPWNHFDIIEMAPTGDVNDDGKVNVTDYVATAGYILEMDPQPFYLEECDFNDSGTVSISDLVGVATRVLSFEGAPMLAPAVGMTEAPTIAMAADVNGHDGNYEVSINLNNNIDFTALQMDLNLPAGLTLVDVSLSDRASASHQVAFNQLNNGDYRLLASSPLCKSFTGNDGAVLTLTLAGELCGDGIIRNIELATPRGASYKVDDIELHFTSPTGVENMTAATATRIYSDGSNIIIDSPVNGTAQIVLPNGISKTVTITAGKNIFPAPASGMVIVKMDNSIKKLQIK